MSFSVALSDALPGGVAGQQVVTLLSRVEEVAATAGYYAAMAEASRLLRAARSLHSRQRRFVGDALHNSVRMLRRLRRLTQMAAAPTLRKPTALQLYLVWLVEQISTPEEAVPVTLSALLAGQGLTANGLQAARRTLAERLARFAGEAGPDAAGLDTAGLDAASLDAAARVEAIGEALSYPSWLVRCFLDAFGWQGEGLKQAIAILAAQNERAPLCVRVNRLRASREEAIPRLQAEGLIAQPTKVASDGLYLEGHANAYATTPFAEGWIELQDEGSQLIAELCSPPPGGVIVDVCAGAGGKTLALGALLQNRGRLLALDVDRRKLTELSRRVRRAGLTNVQGLLVPENWMSDGGAAALPSWLQSVGAERVLVDAPCSGLGVLRRNPEARWRLQESDLAELTAIQSRLLHGAAALVRPHGRLIYSTCTVLPRENEEIVAGFLAAHPDFSLVPVKEILGGSRAALCSDADGRYLRTWPQAGGADGFFAAVLRRAKAPPLMKEGN